MQITTPKISFGFQGQKWEFGCKKMVQQGNEILDLIKQTKIDVGSLDDRKDKSNRSK
jgi:hypothetical protein